MERYTEYDPFAWIYHRHWGEHSVRKFSPILEQLLLPRLTAHAQVLDLCCGTGQNARWLIDHGYHVTSLDGSEAMLRFARETAPTASFVLADARQFSLPPIHHAAISLFDSLNHILSCEELAAVFNNTYAALLPGGIFFCDFNIRKKFLDGWKGDFSIVEDDHACLVRTRYDDETRLAMWDITIFHLRGTWERSDLVLTQRAYEEDEIYHALAEAGFSEICIADDARGLEGVASLPVGKTYFLAIKR